MLDLVLVAGSLAFALVCLYAVPIIVVVAALLLAALVLDASLQVAIGLVWLDLVVLGHHLEKPQAALVGALGLAIIVTSELIKGNDNVPLLTCLGVAAACLGSIYLHRRPGLEAQPSQGCIGLLYTPVAGRWVGEVRRYL